MNKLTKKVLLFLSMFGVAFLFLGMQSSNNHVEAAAYGRGAKFTLPKSYRGTWYSYDSGLSRKLKITTHTFDGQTVYKISSTKARNSAADYAQSHNDSKSRTIVKSVGNLIGVKYVKHSGKTYLYFTPWLANIGTGYFRATTKKIKGHERRVLTYTASFGGWNISGTYYTSKSLAKQMR
ncbi:hypothetical protein [Lactobacillus sp.]|uniref:hypothetical protein n=1 Tax=Lactobacillus sp. TaxID=1591 RepID=UPI0019C93155|nr:hypothetical protein [Lactobacillus sp.]MBD5430455.1 hypothetical protein [Lactobacillus sp.]